VWQLIQWYCSPVEAPCLLLQLQKELQIPTISQRLWYAGTELDDNTATMESLGVLSGDTFELKEQYEDYGDLEVDDQDNEGSRKKLRRDEGAAFSGTLLAGTLPNGPVAAQEVAVHGYTAQSSSICPACTFANLPDAGACDICETWLS
jgi:hypothetical protein